MNRYIDIETALNIIDNYKKSATEDVQIAIQAVRDIVEWICPEADAQEVVHAHWIRHKNSVDDCSKCGCSFMILSYTRGNYKYCPNCGAKMDEVIDE